MKLKEFGPILGEGTSLVPPQDPPMPGDIIFYTSQNSNYLERNFMMLSLVFFVSISFIKSELNSKVAFYLLDSENQNSSYIAINTSIILRFEE